MIEEDERLIEELQRRIQYQLNHTWVNLIDSTAKDQFLSNFKDEERIAGLVLLDMLLLHNQAQEKQLMKTLLRKLQLQIYKSNYPYQKENSEQIASIVAEEMKSAAFIPVIDKNPADSSNAWSSIVREVTGTSDCFYDVETLPILLSTHKKYIVFYDDMLGTGNQFDDYLKNQRYSLNKKHRLSIAYLLNCNERVQYYYLCMGGYEEGIKRIKSEYPKLQLIVSEQFTEEDSVLSPNNEYWAYYKADERDKIIKILQKKIEEQKINEPFTRNLTAIFERNRPSNTVFPLYWYNKNDWSPIKARE